MIVQRCQYCRHGIAATDPGNETTPPSPYVVCALFPPQKVWIGDRSVDHRPLMRPFAWCGQFKFSLRRVFGYGPRA